MKKIISIIISILMLATISAISAFAENDILSYLSYEINNNEVSITDCDTSIGGNIEIPDTIEGYPVTTLGDNAFAQCLNLKGVIIGNNVKTIGYKTFFECFALEELTIGSSVTIIGESAFAKCGSLKIVEIPESVTTIGDYTFSYCTNLTDCKISGNVTKIGKCAFYHCSSLRNMTIPENVTSIGSQAFGYCDSLDEIVIPAGVTVIGDAPFVWCKNLTSIIVDKNNVNYSSDENGVLFNKDKTELIQYPVGSNNTEYAIPDGVTEIDIFAFYDAEHITKIIIPVSVTKIGYEAFFLYGDIADIFYVGSLSQWKQITLVDDAVFSNAIIHCNKKDDSSENIIGDVNGDGKITAADARIVLRISAKLDSMENYNLPLESFDVTGDGKLTAADARKILRISAKLE